MEVNIIYGPPGTGKTTSLMNILDFEINTKYVPIEKIAFVTFTRKGIEVGVNKTSEKFNIPKNSMPYFRTLHSLAYSFSGIAHSSLMDRYKYYDFSKKVGMHFTGYYDAELQSNDDKYLFWNDLYRNNKAASKKLYEQLDTKKVHFVMNQYLRFKQTLGYADYTDLIEKTVQEKQTVPVEVVILDEAQDLTTLQWRMFWTVFAHCKRVYIAGDDDQSIYQWAGADVNAFLNVNGHKEVLKESWRLPQKFVDFSKNISKQISVRIDKEYKGQNRLGRITYVNSLDEISYDKHASYLCLARNNIYLPQYVAWADRHIAPFRLKGECSITNKDVNAIKEYEEIRKTHVMSSYHEKKFSNIIDKINLNNPWYDAFNWDPDKILRIRNLIAEKRILEEPKINVSTIHAIKGDEADNVIIMSDITKNVKEQLDTDPDSEHRVFYVAATRAKQRIIIVKPQGEHFYGGLFERERHKG